MKALCQTPPRQAWSFFTEAYDQATPDMWTSCAEQDKFYKLEAESYREFDLEVVSSLLCDNTFDTIPTAECDICCDIFVKIGDVKSVHCDGCHYTCCQQCLEKSMIMASTIFPTCLRCASPVECDKVVLKHVWTEFSFLEGPFKGPTDRATADRDGGVTADSRSLASSMSDFTAAPYRGDAGVPHAREGNFTVRSRVLAPPLVLTPTPGLHRWLLGAAGLAVRARRGGVASRLEVCARQQPASCAAAADAPRAVAIASPDHVMAVCEEAHKRRMLRAGKPYKGKLPVS